MDDLELAALRAHLAGLLAEATRLNTEAAEVWAQIRAEEKRRADNGDGTVHELRPNGRGDGD